MKILISPSKKFNTPEVASVLSIFNLEKTKKLFFEISQYDINEIKAHYRCSTKIANEVKNYWNNFNLKTYEAKRLFSGLVFSRIKIDTFTKEEDIFFNKHVLILDAFYGIIKPHDKISKYRLDHLTDIGINLYKFWDLKIEGQIINLASKEFSKMISQPMFNINFLQHYKDKEVAKATECKIARGTFLNWVIKNKINDICKFKKFNELGYEVKNFNKNEITFLLRKGK